MATEYTDGLTTLDTTDSWAISNDPWGGGTPTVVEDAVGGPGEACVKILGNDFGGKGMTYKAVEIPADWTSITVKFSIWSEGENTRTVLGLIFSADYETKTMRESTNANDVNEADDYYACMQRGSYHDEFVNRVNSGSNTNLRTANDMAGNTEEWIDYSVTFVKNENDISIVRTYGDTDEPAVVDSNAGRHTDACHAAISSAYTEAVWVKDFVLTVEAASLIVASDDWPFGSTEDWHFNSNTEWPLMPTKPWEGEII